MSLILPQELSRGLKELGQREGATLFMTMLASFHLLLSRYTGQNDVAVGTPIAGRRWAETEDLIGFFVNTLVLRTAVDASESFRELLAQVREKTLEAYAHQDVPFEKLVEELHPERDLARTPLFQVMFVLQNAPQTELQIPGLTLSGMNIESNAAKFDLMLMMAEEHGLLHAGLSYRSGWFSENSMRRLLSHWENLLTGIVTNPQMAVPASVDAHRGQNVRRLSMSGTVPRCSIRNSMFTKWLSGRRQTHRMHLQWNLDRHS